MLVLPITFSLILLSIVVLIAKLMAITPIVATITKIERGLITVIGMVAVVIIPVKKLLIVIAFNLLHHQNQYQIDSLQQVLHFYHKQNKLQLLYALETLTKSIY